MRLQPWGVETLLRFETISIKLALFEPIEQLRIDSLSSLRCLIGIRHPSHSASVFSALAGAPVDTCLITVDLQAAITTPYLVSSAGMVLLFVISACIS